MPEEHIATKKTISIERLRQMSAEVEAAAETAAPAPVAGLASRIIRSLLHAKYGRKVQGIPRTHVPLMRDNEDVIANLKYVRWPTMTPSLGMSGGGGFVISEPEMPPTLPLDLVEMDGSDPDNFCVCVTPLLIDDEKSCYAVVPPQGYPDMDAGNLVGGEQGSESIFAGEGEVTGETRDERHEENEE